MPYAIELGTQAACSEHQWYDKACPACRVKLDSMLESIQADGDSQIKPSGNTCCGITFEIPAIDMTDVHAEKLYPSQSFLDGIIPVSEPTAYRVCLWDCTLTAPTENGGNCPNCDRMVKDNDKGVLPEGYFVPVRAVQCYIEQLRCWLLAEVPPATVNTQYRSDGTTLIFRPEDAGDVQP